MSDTEKLERIEYLIKYALDNVAQKYYTLETASFKRKTHKDEIKIMIRERFFCYELYHQMRCDNQDYQLLDTNLVLSAEISKNGHDVIENKKIPDFIIHEPGNMDNNLIVIEVKGNMDRKGIAKDFNTLSLFLNDCKYKKGIFILYNHDLKDLRSNMKDIMNKKMFKNISNKNVFSKIKILCKKSQEADTEEAILENLIL